MTYPCLVRIATTDIVAEVAQESIGNYGIPLDPVSWTGKCNYQDSAKTVLTSDKKMVEVNGVALIPGDICPTIATISGGSVTVFGQDRRIAAGRKHRNPDGTVNFTELDVI